MKKSAPPRSKLAPFGVMLLAVLTIFVVPVLYCGLAEIAHRFTR